MSYYIYKLIYYFNDPYILSNFKKKFLKRCLNQQTNQDKWFSWISSNSEDVSSIIPSHVTFTKLNFVFS